MAEDKKKSKISSALARLTPNAIKMTVDGQEIVVASSKDENDTLNMITAAQLRNVLHRNMKKIEDLGNVLTPKELKELTEAARNIAEFSTEIYKEATPLSDAKPTEKKVDPTGPSESLDDINFGKITTPIDIKTA